MSAGRLGVLALLTCTACGVGAKQTVLAEALDARDDRKENFEAILRVLDEHPDYVDEFFVQARGHQPTLDRFIQNAAQNLHEDDLAKLTAKHLANNPPGLRKILVETIKASKDKPEARQAIAKAIGDEVDLATDIMTDDPIVVREAMLATVRHVMGKDESRRAFVQAMYGASPVLARILAANPNVLTKMFQELTGELGDDPELVEQLVGELTQKTVETERQPTRGE